MKTYRNVKKEQHLAEESSWLRHIFGLPFLSHNEVGDSFAEDFVSDMPANDKIQQFSDYLLDTYISDDAIFPPHIWASFTDEPVTTNPCESFHSHFKNKFYQAHPDVFTFTRQLLSTQTFVYIKLQSVHEPLQITGNKQYRERRARLLSSKEKYTNGEIGRKQYVVTASVSGRV